MKALAVLLALCFTSAFATTITELKRGSSQMKVSASVRQCLIDYDVDPAVLELDIDRSDDLYASLSEEKKGCVTACVYRGFNWLKPDGSLDIEILCEGETPEESEAEKERYTKIIAECRADVGNNDCKFFNCLSWKNF